MTSTLVFTFIGADKPGLIEQLSNAVSQHGGNWLESRMSQLAGHFTGITRVQVSRAQADELKQALMDLSGDDLTISIHSDKSSNEDASHKLLQIHLLGNDRPGIVRELSSALASRNINVCKMDTGVTSAAMTADSLFEATADIEVPSQLDISELHDKLDEIANDLAVDINLESEIS